MCADCLQPVASEGRSTVIVLDTNILLDLWVFDDARAEGLRTALKAGQLQWLATTAMRDELERVLAYPQIVRSLQHHGRVAGQVLAQFDALAQLRPVPPKAPVTCKDPDDQKFIDLAVAHPGILLSKDNAVLSMQKRLAALRVVAQATLPSV
jgi:putative PIN family toxin of toxin-antitoxin system